MSDEMVYFRAPLSLRLSIFAITYVERKLVPCEPAPRAVKLVVEARWLVREFIDEKHMHFCSLPIYPKREEHDTQLEKLVLTQRHSCLLGQLAHGALYDALAALNFTTEPEPFANARAARLFREIDATLAAVDRYHCGG